LKLKLLIISIAIALPLMSVAGEIIKKASPYDAEMTMNRFETLLKSKGMEIFSRIDHKANAKAVGMRMNDNLVIVFGKPQVGTNVMLLDPAAGLDLPLRVVVYKDNENQTWIAYRNPESLKNDFKLEECKTIDTLKKVLDTLTSEVIKN
jgi:uncharacterized protein (DUF302 family)